MSDLTLQPISKPFTATFSPPGSKSLTNRALILAAMVAGPCKLSNVLFADDTQVMMDCLRRLGFTLAVDEPRRVLGITGQGGRIPATQAELFCGNSGTTIRFVAALCALGQGDYTLDGIARMRQRPIGELVNLLRDMGVRIDYAMTNGYPPIHVIADGLPGGLLHFGQAASSQFLSAVLMISPYARHEVQVDLHGEQTSWPYVAMTMRLMHEFGLTVELERDPDTGDPSRIVVPQGEYAPTTYAIEPDASNASYFLAAAAINPGSTVTIEGLGRQSLQGDVGFADVLKKMGAQVTQGDDSITVAGPQLLDGIEVDLSDMPDVAQTLAVVSLFAAGRTTIRGLRTLRVKETDRLAALATELTKLGASIHVEGDETLSIDPSKTITPASIATYDDHRMAMSFAVAGTRAHGITLQNVECVNKTYPGFFPDLRTVTGVGA